MTVLAMMLEIFRNMSGQILIVTILETVVVITIVMIVILTRSLVVVITIVMILILAIGVNYDWDLFVSIGPVWGSA